MERDNLCEQLAEANKQIGELWERAAAEASSTPSIAGAGGRSGDQSARLMLTESAKAAILEAQVNTALTDHDLGPFEPVDTVNGGYQAVCRKCGKSVWVGDSGVTYRLLKQVSRAIAG
ncbi:MAG: hypothetical protein WA996_08815 [Candidatus Promineifilaceae bacterium]